MKPSLKVLSFNDVDFKDGLKPSLNVFYNRRERSFFVVVRVWVLSREINTNFLCVDTGNRRTNLRLRRQYESLGLHLGHTHTLHRTF